MFKSVDIYTQRYMQIVVTLMIVQAIYQFTHLPHSQWLLTTASALYSGFNSSTVVKRAQLRFFGTCVGVALVYILWHIIHWDYRLLIIFSTIWMPLWIFFNDIPYNRTVIFTTVFADMSVEWNNANNFFIDSYVQDRLICNIIIIALCIALERLWFGRQNLSYRSFLQTEQNIVGLLHKFWQQSQKDKSSSRNFKLTNQLLLAIDKLSLMAVDAKYEDQTTLVAPRTERLIKLTKQIHSRIVSWNYLYTVAANHSSMATLATTIDDELTNLDMLIKNTQ